MLSRIVTCCKHCQILIRSPLKVKSMHLLSKFRGCILIILEKNKFENCYVKYPLSTLMNQLFPSLNSSSLSNKSGRHEARHSINLSNVYFFIDNQIYLNLTR